MDAMIDIEALGNGTNGLIVSIGAVRFHPMPVTATEHGPQPDAFRACISIQDALNHGAQVEGRTIKWWFEQERTAQMALFESPRPESQVLAMLGNWINKIPLEGIWAHGINYDLRMLAAAYARHGQRIPWPFRLERDTRTLFSLVPYGDIKWGVSDLPKHDPVGDAICQAFAVQSAMRLLAGRERVIPA